MKEGKRYDWYPVLCHSFFDELVTSLYKEVAIYMKWGRGNKRREQSLRPLIKHVISSLYSCFYSFPIGSGYVSYPLGGDAYNTKSEYKVNYTVVNASALFQVLKDKKWITVIPAKNQQSYTRIKASGGLRCIFEEQGFKWSPQKPMPIHKLVKVRDRVPNTNKNSKKKWDKIDMPLPNEPIVKEYQEELFKYNSFMCHHCVSLDVTDDQLFEIGKEIRDKQNDKKRHHNWMAETEEENKIGYLDISSVQLRRIFSRNSLTKHGRFYGGWWQSIPSDYRYLIRIDGKLTVELDYSGISLRILYGLAEEPYQGNADIYDLSDNSSVGIKWKFAKDSHQRKLVKKYINALLNDEDGTFSLTHGEHKQLGFNSKQIKERFLKVHSPIAHLVDAKIGLQTQFYDSQIAMEIMKHFLSFDEVVLPIHDGFIVPAGCVYLLEDEMKNIFKRKFGDKIRVSHEGLKSPEVINLNDIDYSLYEDSLMENYVDDWRKAYASEY
ncbi:hypothetical protein N9M53_07100 [Alphaproteobacteria bacterium]|nr:hypothetical protein [Alphaproteobacteria bacterium]